MLVEWLKHKVTCWIFGHEFILVDRLELVDGKLQVTDKSLVDCARCGDPMDKGY